MSEPVGNGPRQPEGVPSIQANSHRARADAPKEAEEPREKVERIVQGKVVVRKSPWYKRAARSFVADDVVSIREFLIADVLIPSAKNLLRDLIVGGTDRTLYGTTARGGGRGPGLGLRGNVSSVRKLYENMSDQPQQRAISKEGRSRHDFTEVSLDDRQEAMEIIEALMLHIQTYGEVSVADLYDMLGVTGSYMDRAFGWRNLANADVRQYRGSWLLDLPQPVELRR